MPNAFSRPAFLAVFVLCAVLIAALPGCDFIRNSQKLDRDAGYDVQDYRDSLAPRPIPDADKDAGGVQSADVPALQPYITGTSGAGTYKAMPIVSMDVQGQYSLRTLFYELAREGEFDLELDPRIRGSVYFRAQERPLDEVLARLADVAGLRYTFKDNVLRVELDTPYNKTYKIDYLSYIRSAESNITTDISVVSTEGGTDTGSNLSVSSESVSDFWADLDAGLAQILDAPASQVLRTDSDPRLNSTMDTVRADPVGGGQAPDVVLRVDSLPVRGGGGAGDPFAESNGTETRAPYSINRQAGLVSVYATERQHKEIDAYLRVLRRSVTAQVLIEAKILEVALVDQYQTGIDWRILGEKSLAAFTNPSLNTTSSVDDLVGALAPSTSGLSIQDLTHNTILGYFSGDFDVLIQALSAFGAVRGLASPRLSVINNQLAVLNVAENVVYFELDMDFDQGTQDSPGDTLSVDSEIRTVPEGVLVNVIPSINLDDRTISMAIRPSVTRIVDYKNDPAVDIVAATYLASLANAPSDAQIAAMDITSEIPELSVQEIDSVIKVRSGQAIVIGGLLRDQMVSQREGVPGLNEMPGLAGAAFGKKSDYSQKSELVIFLRATIIDDPGDTITDTDRDIYRDFARDRRPWAM